MPSPEAEVVALKLHNLFKEFSLPSHPSFFAGIPSEVLSALLLANRRSELIQLAVDGFLSYIVAEDTDPIRLSRSKRSQFLRRLVVEIKVEKRTFDQAQLVSYAESMSQEYDYGIAALSFVQGFVEKGFIHFEDGKAAITLPFMESYLLAVELADDSKLALRYFDMDDNDIDLLTFDLYSEIKPSVAIIDTVKCKLRAALTALDVNGYEQILLKNDLFPQILKNPARITNLGNRVSEAKAALESDASDRDEKTRILDIAERVNEDVSNRIDGGEPETRNSDDPNPLLSSAIRMWVVATILLGSGAESIKGDERKEIVEIIIDAADMILHYWTKIFSEFDYGQVRQDILADATFKSNLNIDDEKEYERIVSSLIDFVEFVALSEPLERIVNHLLDQGQQPIIGNSLAKAKNIGGLKPLIKGLWLTNINRQAGNAALNEAVAELPEARFFRSTLTSIIIYRVRWKLSQKPTRYTLLDAAQEIVKPINPSLDKGEMRRFVDRDDKDKRMTTSVADD